MLMKFILRCIALPLVLLITLIQWIVLFLVSMSSWIFHLLSGLIFLIALASSVFGIAPKADTVYMLFLAFGVFILPHIAEWLLRQIAALRYHLSRIGRA